MFAPLDKLMKRTATSRGALAVVTGAGSGIGAAFAIELGRRGGTVVCSDIDEAAAQQTADTILERGAKAVAIRCDVSRFDDVGALAPFAYIVTIVDDLTPVSVSPDAAHITHATQAVPGPAAPPAP